jgi:uncharacterized protein YaaQ
VKGLKLVVAVVPADDAARIIDGLSRMEIGVTRINTVGGFLKKGNATLLIGVDEDKVPDALELVTARAKQRHVFVLNVERYERI